MAIAWPSTLPVAPATFGFQAQPVTIRTQPDSGPVKSRRRFTRALYKAQMTFVLTNAQALILDSFFHDDLQAGALQMSFLHPTKGVNVDMTITEAPTFESDGPLYTNATVKVEYF